MTPSVPDQTLPPSTSSQVAATVHSPIVHTHQAVKAMYEGTKTLLYEQDLNFVHCSLDWNQKMDSLNHEKVKLEIKCLNLENHNKVLFF